jgi:DNA topoisomerase VI subunit A
MKYTLKEYWSRIKAIVYQKERERESTCTLRDIYYHHGMWLYSNDFQQADMNISCGVTAVIQNLED